LDISLIDLNKVSNQNRKELKIIGFNHDSIENEYFEFTHIISTNKCEL